MVKMRIKLTGRRGLHSNCSFEHSISRIKWALSRKEIDDALPSNIWWRGRSYAASVASDVSEPQKDRKRVPKEARRAVIESFVDNYKAINAGKFPTVSHTQKEVGGSFYVVRNILQELQKKSTTSHLMSKGVKSFQEKAINEIPNAGSNHLEAASHRQMSPSCTEKTLPSDDKLVSHSTVSTIRNLLEKDSEEASSTSHEEPDNDCKDVGSSDFVHTESHMLKNERERVFTIHLESKPSSEELKYEGSNHKEEQDSGSLELDREKINGWTASDGELSSKAKPWGRIKSIVDGIINMWRNR